MKEISAKDFESLKDTKDSLVLLFWAEWNGHDVKQKKYFEAIENETTNISFYQMNVDIKNNLEVCKEHRVMGSPTISFYKKGEMQESVVGVMKQQQLKDKLCSLNIV
jgi:thiol:disulfide interchange protein